MDDFNTDDLIDDIISSPTIKRREIRESKSLEGSSELRRSTKSVTFVDPEEAPDLDSKGDSTSKQALTAAGKAKADGKPATPAGGQSAKGQAKGDFDDNESPPLGGLDTPRSEESSIAFPDDSPRKTSGGAGGGSAKVNAPKMGFDLFTTSSTVSEELAPKAKKKDFDSFLGSLGNTSNTSGGANAREDAEADDPLNSSGSAYQPWAAGGKSRRPATGEAAPATDIESILQSVDATLRRRPGTAPAPQSTKRTLSRLLQADDDEMFGGTMPPPARPTMRAQQRPAAEETPDQQPPSSLRSSAEALGPQEQQEQQQQVFAATASSSAAAVASVGDDDSAAMFSVARPPTGRRTRSGGGGGDDLAGLFGNRQSEDSYFSSMPSIPLSSEMKAELEGEIKKLRREKEDLRQQVEQLQLRAKDEAARLEESHRRKLHDAEELGKRRDEMLARENDELKQKCSDSLRQMDRERANMRSELNRQLDELAQEKRRNVEQLREQHRNDVEALRSAAPHAGALSNLVERLGYLAEKLGSLSDQESSHRVKDEVHRQTEAADRQVMHEVVQSLKARVDESARSERWLSDLATQLMEERRALAAERSELRVLKLTEGGRQADSEAERQALAEERVRLRELEARLRHGRSEVLRQRSDMETLAEELKLKEEKLRDGQRSLEERLEIVSRRERDVREQQARLDASGLEQADRAKRTDGIQGQLAELRAKEREVSQAMIQLAEERASLDKRAGGLLCANCRTPVRDGFVGGGLKLASSVDFVFARTRNYDELEEEKLYLESLSHAPYG